MPLNYTRLASGRGENQVARLREGVFGGSDEQKFQRLFGRGVFFQQHHRAVARAGAVQRGEAVRLARRERAERVFHRFGALFQNARERH